MIDAIPAEKTISMWVHDEGLDGPADSSMENTKEADDYQYYTMSEFSDKVQAKLEKYDKKG